MRLATKAATLLATTALVANEQTRATLTEQADAALALIAAGDGDSAGLANAALDSACSEAIHRLKREGWTLDRITERVSMELRNAGIRPTVRSGAAA